MGIFRNRQTTPVNEVMQNSMRPEPAPQEAPQAPAPVMQNKVNRPNTVLSGNWRDRRANNNPNGFFANRGFGQEEVQQQPATPVAKAPVAKPVPVAKAPAPQIARQQDLNARVGGLSNAPKPGDPGSTNQDIRKVEQQAKDEKLRKTLQTPGGLDPTKKPKLNPSLLGQKPQETNSVNTQGSPFPIPDKLAQQQAQSQLGQKWGGLGYDPTGSGGGTPPPQMGGGSPMNPNYVNPSPSAQKPAPFNEQEFYQNNG